MRGLALDMNLALHQRPASRWSCRCSVSSLFSSPLQWSTLT